MNFSSSGYFWVRHRKYFFAALVAGLVLIFFYVCNAAPIKGIDVSAFQADIDWEVVSQSDIEFVFIKASEGIGFSDPRFRENWQQSHKAKLYRSAYHFFSFQESGTAQAHFFLKQFNGKGYGEIPPVLDFEWDEKFCTVSDAQKKQARTAVKDWAKVVSNAVGHSNLILYTNPFTAECYSLDQTISDAFHLWLAQYDVGKPDIVGTWRNVSFWQYTDIGRIAGVPTAVDLDRFMGDRIDFYRILNRGP